MSIVKMVDGKPQLVEESTKPAEDLREKHPSVYADEAIRDFFDGFESVSDEQIEALREIGGFDEILESIGDGKLMYNAQTGSFYVFTNE